MVVSARKSLKIVRRYGRLDCTSITFFHKLLFKSYMYQVSSDDKKEDKSTEGS